MRKRALKVLALILSLFFTSLAVCPVAVAHTGIGNGGDVMDAYLSDARYRVTEIFRRFMQEGPDARGAVCAQLELTTTQKSDCAAFLQATAAEYISLHTGPNPVPFEISATPVYVDGPDGEPLRVAARTWLGAEGPITFDYELIASRSPRLLLALLIHETGHKVTFHYESKQGSKLHVEDDLPVLSFATGRQLLDSAGLAMAEYAVRERLIGDTYALVDQFWCKITFNDASRPIIVSTANERDFLNDASQANRFAAFDMIIGYPKPAGIKIGDGENCLAFHLRAHEEADCQDAHDPATRYTEMEIYRIFKRKPGEAPRPNEAVATKRLNDFNPACAAVPDVTDQPMTIATPSMTFTCQYKGAQADPLNSQIHGHGVGDAADDCF